MVALTLIINIFLGSTIAGSAVVVALTLGLDTAVPIIAAAVAGFVAAFPASYLIAKSLSRAIR